MPDIKEFNKKDLSSADLKAYEFALQRIKDLHNSRKNIYGTNIESIWNEADRAYVPHRLQTKGKRRVISDDEKGWRSSLVTIGARDWQTDIANANPFIKINIALSILIDRNPKGVFTALAKKFENTSLLMSQLYTRSWELAKSKQQLKLFILNLAKYGWSCGRTYPLKITRKVETITEYNEDEPEKSVKEKKEVEVYNDVFREALDPWNCWIDDMAKPNNSLSIRDWTWRKIYDRDTFDEEFGKYKLHNFVKEGGNTTEKLGDAVNQKQYQEKKLIEVNFYENVQKDLFIVTAGAGDVPVVIDSLPIGDAEGIKKLSLWQAYWTLRHGNIPYGIGIYESARYENAMLDRVRNMTLDQLTLSIYKSWFYQGTQNLSETGDIELKPGVGRQVLNPKDIKFVEIPSPGVEAWKGIEILQKAVDEATGITPPLAGEITGKTAFEVAQAKEAALGRLKFPLDNICDALEQEGYITISLIQLIYSIPEVIKIQDQDLIEKYLNEIQSNPELYERKFNEKTEEEDFYAKVYPEVPLNLEEDHSGNLIETEKTRFFRIKPKFLQWEGIINIDPQSILAASKQLNKTLDLEMYNMIIPLLAQPPETYSKVAKNIVKLYDKDPKEILPDTWLMENTKMASPLFVPQEQENKGQKLQSTPTGQVLAAQPQGLAQKIIGKLTAPFKRV